MCTQLFIKLSDLFTNYLQFHTHPQLDFNTSCNFYLISARLHWDFNIDLVGFPAGCHPDSLFLFASSSISSASTIPNMIPVCCTVVHTPTKSSSQKNRIMDKKNAGQRKKLVQALPLTSGECNAQ